VISGHTARHSETGIADCRRTVCAPRFTYFRGRINKVQDTYNANTSTHASSIGYAPNGTLDSMVIGHPTFSGNTMVENTTLNTLWQITNRNLQIGSAFPVTLGFTYGAAGKNNGNLTQQTIVTTAAPNPPPGVSIPAVNLTQTYGYDAYDRLLTATETGGTAPEWAQTYLYDQFGNRAVQSGSYIPNPNGTPSSTSQFTGNRWTSATYDAAGDETTVPGSTSETFTYDGEYRAYTANANGAITYSYDGEGRRVQKTASTFQTNYVYDSSGKEIMESTIPGTGFPTEAPYTGTEYLIPDHLGSSRLAINGQGQVVRRYDFLPFGEELKAGLGGRGADYEPSTYIYPTTPDDVTRKFTGKDRDWETGLDFFGARYMSSAQGRFTSPDWSEKPVAIPRADLLDPQTVNLYAYLRGRSLSSIDPDGHGNCEAAAGASTAKWLTCKGVVSDITGYFLTASKVGVALFETGSAQMQGQLASAWNAINHPQPAGVLLGEIPVGPPGAAELGAAEDLL
jgi:RHS repeat-associated protein